MVDWLYPVRRRVENERERRRQADWIAKHPEHAVTLFGRVLTPEECAEIFSDPGARRA